MEILHRAITWIALGIELLAVAVITAAVALPRLQVWNGKVPNISWQKLYCWDWSFS